MGSLAARARGSAHNAGRLGCARITQAFRIVHSRNRRDRAPARNVRNSYVTPPSQPRISRIFWVAQQVLVLRGFSRRLLCGAIAPSPPSASAARSLFAAALRAARGAAAAAAATEMKRRRISIWHNAPLQHNKRAQHARERVATYQGACVRSSLAHVAFIVSSLVVRHRGMAHRVRHLARA